MSSPHAPEPPRFSEAQLRDALHSAVGDGSLDPNALIGRARAVRARRRTGVLAAGLVAAVVAVGVGVATRGDSGGETSASTQQERNDTAGGSNEGGGSSGSDGSDLDAPKDQASPSDVPSRMPVAPPTNAPGPGDIQLSPTPGTPLESDKYADREPLAGTGCPAQRDPLDAPTGPASTGALLDFAPTGAYACVYFVDGSSAVAALTDAETAGTVSVLSRGGRLSADMACTSDFGPSIRLLITGAGGRSATIDAETYGCGVVTNGTASRQAKAQVVALLTELDPKLRPIS